MKKLSGLMFIFIVFVLGGCSEKPTASDRFSEYISLWNNQKFSEMYDMLTVSSKENISKEDYINRYKDIYEGVSVSNLQVEYNKPNNDEKNDEEIEVVYPYSLSMETIAGNVSFEQEVTIKKEKTENEENWFISWQPAMIFPELEGDEKVKVSSIAPTRGQIFDKNDNPLAINGVAHNIGIVPGDLPEKREEVLSEVSSLLGVSVSDIEAELNQSWVKPDLFVPIKSIDPENSELLQKLVELPSIHKRDVEARSYPLGEAAAHLTGYIGSITAEELKEFKDKGYSDQSKIGKAGLEQIYEEKLKGQTGYKIFVDGTEKIIAEKPAVEGETIKVTIDREIQTDLYNQLKGDSGTAVALHPKTGETLALVSSPSYNPNEFIYGLSSEQYNNLSNNPNKPLMARFNKTYSPGSVIKPITATIGLNNEIIKPSDNKIINGKTWQKDNSWGNYYISRVSEKVSNVNLQTALIYSDNIYFAQLALEIGPEKLNNGLRSFGFEEELEYAYPVSKSSISSSGLNNETLLADTGYGQGELQMSPLHLATTYTAFVNGGNIINPSLEIVEGEKESVWKENAVSVEHAQTILNDLKQVVNDPNGTAYKPNVENQNLAGKTGTAELKTSKNDEQGKENGWFVAIDYDNPELLIAMMIEDVKTRGGSHYVVPKVKQVFKENLTQ
ncbi:penicillin-binding transpeptidase domain-containing protein [Metabacillus litoralis]|uniref:serine-type D-Ala-D-Ala carboxypeptidase n=1 Tax=Metabacillus litoralis TaxID=152268 RepID=A0A5C6W6R7_9BACI|nr:penicillin-binding transpeptidase domain-containing protein [Metabacillus litoralis]TXC91550.1 penicillin-binding transpeptidase domain-containing protein [Metabacillus litoralis]